MNDNIKKIISETSEETKQKAREYGDFLAYNSNTIGIEKIFLIQEKIEPILLFVNYKAMQGDWIAPRKILRKLVKDNRHYALQIVECCEVEARRWNKWSMNYLTPTDKNRHQALKYSTGTEFNPYLMSTNQIMMFIDSLSAMQEQERKKQQQQQVQTRELAVPTKKKSWFSFS